MNTQAMNAMPQRLSIYDPRRDRMVSLNPYKAKAKEIYRHYIEDLGFDPSLVLPPDLVYYEKSGYFRRNPTKQVKIEGRTAYYDTIAWIVWTLDMDMTRNGYDLEWIRIETG